MKDAGETTITRNDTAVNTQDELISRTQVIKDLQEWKERLGSSCQEEFVSVILAAVIDKIKGYPPADKLA